MSDQALRRELDGYLRERPPQIPTPWDSHPTLEVRLAALGEMDPGPTSLDSAPALTWLDRADHVLATFDDWLHENRQLQPVAWDELASVTGEARCRQLAGLVNRAASCTAGGGRHARAGATVWTLIEALTEGQATDLLIPVFSELPTAPAAAHTADLLTGFFATCLLDGGLARVAHDWGTPHRLVSTDGATLHLDAMVADAVVNPEQTMVLASWLDQIGLDPLAVVAPDLAGQQEAPAKVLATLTYVSTGSTGTGHLLVLDHGLLVIRLGPARAVADLVTQFFAPRRADLALEQLLAAPVAALCQARGSRLIPWSELTDVSLTRAWLTQLRIASPGPAALRFTTTTSSRSSGNPVGALEDRLDDRCRWTGRRPFLSGGVRSGTGPAGSG